MKSEINLNISINSAFPEKNIYRVEVEEEQIVEWCMKLSLLEYRLIDALRIKGNGLTLPIRRYPRENPSLYSSVVKGKDGPELIVSEDELASWIAFYLIYYRDGKSPVDHMDVQIYEVEESIGKVFHLTLAIPWDISNLDSQWPDTSHQDKLFPAEDEYMDDYHKASILWTKAVADKLTQHEITLVVNELQKNTLEDAIRSELLKILGAAVRSSDNVKEHRQLVESFLEYKSNPTISASALFVLCLRWKDTEMYLEKVQQFLGGVEWDSNNECQLMAIAIAGEYLDNHSNKDFLQHLIYMFENTNNNEFTQQAVYEALAMATGHSTTGVMNTSQNKQDPNVIIEAKERLSRETDET
jgi:hypothetical protein